MNIQLPPLVALCLLTVSAVPGQLQQDPSRPLLQNPVAAIQSAHGLSMQDGQLLGSAYDYEVRFGRGGLEFIPVLGEKAPKTMPVRLTLDSIHRGGVVAHQVAPLDTGSAAARPAVSEKVATYYRRGIEERYEIRQDGVEQSFVFPRRPAGTGDLVVRLRVETELVAPRGRNFRTLKFDLPRVGGVEVGAITGIGAMGRRSPGSMNFDGEYLELVLPARFVDRAAYPMVLDPVIGAYQCVLCSNGNFFNPDASYDSTTDTYMVVFESWFSVTDRAIRAVRLSGRTGAPIGGLLAITPLGKNAGNCAVANLNLRDRFVVTWQEASGSWDIKARSIAAATGAMAAEFSIAATSAQEVRPDICGDSTTVDDEVCIVYGSGSQILWAECTINAAGAGSVARRRTISTDGRNPAISKHGGRYPQDYCAAVVWEASNTHLGVRLMSLDSVPLSATGLISGKNPRRPDVDGNGSRFICAYTVDEPTTNKGDIWCIDILRPSSPTSVWGFTRKRAVDAGVDDNEYFPAVACLGSKYLVTRADDFGSVRTTVFVSTLTPDCRDCGREFEGGTIQPGYFSRSSTIASKFAGGSASDEALVVFDEYRSIAPIRLDIRGYRWKGSVGGTTQNIGGGCSGGGSMSVAGSFSFGNSVTYRLTGAQSGASLAAVSLGFPGQRARFRCGSCSIMLGVRQYPVSIRAGVASWNLALPCDPRFYGAEIDAQYWVAVTTTRPCPTYPFLSVSNIVRNRLVD